MKAILGILSALVLISGLSSAAQAKKEPYTSFTCKTNPRFTDEKAFMTLRQTSRGPVVEGKTHHFHLQVFNGAGQLLVSTPVSVETEDVIFNFQDQSGRVHGTVYLDEYDQTSLTLDGHRLTFICE